ncbi:protein kinase domain-containing protein [Aliikangiella sp. IMCC44359]|uniref:protein kinase domain-containing protein n=1 Tax=Aliikangiella sp. IMCC44359 TaxID=3459125 RepID=UPI00403A9D2E
MLKNLERERVKNIFYEACQLTKNKQLSFIKKECEGNKKLIAEVKSLLSSYEKSTLFFQQLAQSLLGNELVDDENEIDLSPDPYNIIDTQVNHYLIQSKLGSGGMGVVYKAKDIHLKRTVALKFLPLFLQNDPIAIKRFRQEATTASNIDHINIGTIFSVEETMQGFPFISMAYYEGETLEAFNTHNQFNFEQYISIFYQIANGLKAAHNNGIIHRDIKPANIILLDNNCIKIIDFGLAKISNEQFTRTGIKMGTLSYMSPEHIKGETIDHTSDIWSLGVLMFELTAQKKPFTGTTDPAIMHSVLNNEPDIAPLNLPLAFKKILACCLNKNKSQRFQSTDELCRALKSIQQTTASNNIFSSNKKLHYFFLKPKKFLTLLLLTALITLPLIILNNFNTNLLFNQQISANQNIGIAVVSFQNDLSHHELELINSVSQTLTKISDNKANFWFITEKKTRDYKLTDLTKIKSLFGTNFILNIQLNQVNNRYNIQAELINSETLKITKSFTAKQSSSNLVSLKTDLNNQLLKLFNISESNIRENLNKLETSKPKAYEAYIKAIALLERSDIEGNTEKAIDLLKLAITHDPQYIKAMIKLADSYRWLHADKKDIENANKAEKLYEKILAIYPDEITSYLSLAKLHSLQGRMGTALASYQLALMRSPNNQKIYTGIANIYEKSNQLDKAEENLLKSININPNDWNNHNNLGSFYIRQNRYQDAIKPFKKVVALTPGNSWGYNNLGVSYWYLNQTNETIKYFRQSLSIKEDYTIYKNTASLYYYQHNFEQAIKMYEKALELNQKDYKVWGGLAASYFYANKNINKVNRTFYNAIDLALKNQPNSQLDTDLISNLAYYYAFINQTKLSELYLRKLLNSDNLTAQLTNNIALIYTILKQESKAIIWLKKAIKLGYAKQAILNSPEYNQLLSTQQINELFKQK